MKKAFTICMLAQLIVAPGALARSLPAEDVRIVPFYFSLFPPIDTTGGSSAPISPALSVNLLAGKTYGLNGLEIGTILNLKDDYANGVQVASVANIIGGSLRGVQAGSVNVSKRMDFGVQAGAVNITGNAHGVQSGSVNVAKNLNGAQFGAVNVADETQGAQFGSVNIAGDMEGAQFGAVNVRGDSQGLQAGSVNVAKNLGGAQLGVVNTGKRVNGLQMGVINVAEEFNGLNLGLFNFYGNGHQAFELLSQTNGFNNLSFISGSQHIYTSFSGGYRQSGNGQLASAGVGLGLRIPVFFLVGKLELQQGMVTTQPGNFSQWTPQGAAKASIGIQFSRRLALKGGAAVNWMAIDPSQIGVPSGSSYRTNRGYFYPSLFAGIEF